VVGISLCLSPGAVANAGTGTYDPDAAARYAAEWSRTLRGVPQYNPAYPRLDDDAANFVSQALEAGGWKRRGPDWTPRGPGRAWSNAADLHRFAVADTGRATTWGRSTPHSDDIWTLTPGSLLFVDWQSDGRIDHVLIVVGLTTFDGFTEPTVSQHSPHRHRMPLSDWIKIEALDHAAMSFHPVVPE
jgi:hypothetical protein